MLQDDRKLEDLTNEELGKLFPIEIVPYDKKWVDFFKSEAELIIEALGQNIALTIEHFGSTAIKGLSTKPAIDILVKIPSLTDELKELLIQKMNKLDYTFIWRTDEQPPYMNFVKGYTINGLKGHVFHIHMVDKTHSLWDRIYFRDYLRKSPGVAKEYEQLKRSLADKYKFDREAYTKGKEEFVKRITRIAKN
jgi:GrpB-like predicted nucleotidyltransferase (UPF0157 family)